MRAGAVGTCAAKLSETEVFAAHGLKGILVTTQVAGRQKIERAAALAQKHPDTIFVVDDERTVRDLDAAAGARRGRTPTVVNVAIDWLYGRTGISAGEPAGTARASRQLAEARAAGRDPGVRRRGVTHTFDARRTRSLASMGQAVETRRLFESAGLACPLSCGSTGTYNIDSEIDGVWKIGPSGACAHDPPAPAVIPRDSQQSAGQPGVTRRLRLISSGECSFPRPCGNRVGGSGVRHGDAAKDQLATCERAVL